MAQNQRAFWPDIISNKCASHTWYSTQHSKDGALFLFRLLWAENTPGDAGGQTKCMSANTLSEHEDETCASGMTLSVRTVSEV